MMNFWIPGFHDWNIGFEAVDMPWYARYDYVEVWDYVPPEDWDNYPVANQWHPFTQRWRDDFDTLDENRWVVSDDWSFNDNLVMFEESQVYVENGELVLKLEPRGSDGTDNTGGGSDNSGGSDNNCDCQQHQVSLTEIQATMALLQQ